MTSNESVSAKTYVVVFLLLGLIWNCVPMSATVQGQTLKQQSEKKTSGKTRTEKEEKVIFRNDTNSGLWGNNDTSARGGNSGGKGKGKTDPTPTPTPDPTPTPSPTPTPTPNPTPSPTPDPGSSLSRQWQVASRPGLKFYVDHAGWYKVSAQELLANGFDPSSDNYYWQLFRDGDEVPMAVDSDGSVEFFGSGTDSRYTKYGVYYLTSGDQAGIRLQEAADQGAGSTASQSYMAQAIEKPRQNYAPAIVNGDATNWFGPVVRSQVATTLNFDVSEMDFSNPNGQVRVSVTMQGYSGGTHTVSVRFNAMDLGTVTYSGQSNASFDFDVPSSEVLDGQNQFTFQAIGSSWDLSFVDTLSVTYPKKLQANGQKIRFGVSAGDSARVGGFSDFNFSVYEVADRGARKKVAVAGELVNGTHGFSLSADFRDREFVAVAETQKEPVARIEINDPSSWNASYNSAAFVIVTPAAFEPAASALATRRNAQGLQTSVVRVEDIADEFGFGIASAEALRSFFEHASGSWSGPPQYVLLFGDSSYDFRNYLGLASNRNFVPTKMIETFDMETASDGWLVDFDDDGVENLSIGRLPVASAPEAAAAVAKIERYESYSGNPQRFAALVADNWFEIPNQNLESLLPSNVASTRIERSALGDSATSAAIVQNANADPTMVSYLGHGTPLSWTDANLFTNGMASSLTNDKLSFYLLMTCLNGYSQDPTRDSLAESLVKAQNGAIAAWASSGSTYASGQTEMSRDVVTRVFTTSARIGDIVRLGKQTSNDWDARRTWQLFGDPTVVIR